MSENKDIHQKCKIPDNIKDYPNVIPYTDQQKAQLWIINGFKLKDLTKGLEPENREMLFVLPFSVHMTTSSAQYQQVKNQICDHFLPLKLYNPNDTFYQMQYKNQEYVKQNYTESGIPRFLLKHQFSTMSPIELADYYNNNSIDYEKFIQETKIQDDPDIDYIQYSGSEFISWQERRQKEQENPFIYLFYTKDIVNGCEHYYRDAFPICADCGRVVPCRFCHDNIVDDHECNRRKFELMHCLLCNKIGKISNICEHCGGKVSDIFCDICKTLCQLTSQVKPGYHCEHCGVCRVGLKNSSIHCFKCNTCYDSNQSEQHKCVTDAVCSICQEDLRQTIYPEVQLRCNPEHRMHATCFEKLLNEGIFTCPIDHKIIIDPDQYAVQRGKIYHFYRNQKIKYNEPSNIIQIRRYQCYDCNQWNYDFFLPTIPSICHKCFGINCFEHDEECIAVQPFLEQTGKYPDNDVREQKLQEYHELLNQNKGNLEISQIVEYIMIFNDHYKNLTPKLHYESQYQTLQRIFMQILNMGDDFTPQ